MVKNCDNCKYEYRFEDQVPCCGCAHVNQNTALPTLWEPKTLPIESSPAPASVALKNTIITNLVVLRDHASNLHNLTYAQHDDIQQQLDYLKKLFRKAECGQC